MFTRRAVLAGGATMTATRPSLGQPQPVIRLGVLNDQSSTYRDNGGVGSVACVRQAVAEFAAANGLTVEIVSADHQNRPDLGVSIARQWFEQGVDVLLDIQGSAIALALNNLVRERDKVMLASNVAVAELTGRSCTANTVHWAYDTYMLARSTGTAVVRAGGDTWFFIRADYSFGKALQDDATTFVTRAGGRVVGSVAMPFPSSDFSSALLQAQASRAKVVGLANAGDDLVNCIKQAGEFGLTRRGQRMVALLLFINNVHALGLEAAQGLTLTESFYWDLNDRTRALSERVVASGFSRQSKPNMSQAAAYSATLHYLKAVAAIGPAEAKRSGAAVVARMKTMPVEDDAFGGATLREDGRVVSPAYLFEVKRPGESRGAWDYYKLISTVPPEEAWRPLQEGGCGLVRGA
ncbi:ABC transporter substrate-binding protein [Plastoroseomonas hellenica]|uniref:ABC transporter substrate-binding protein n=1 Tax=Plastoroseomonas hellenica TaxID=2687306 RepID=UPI001BAAB9FD|nr:ABC transporter substrate-binding protein [Plastoroseomonas hellenica]MBR0642017.1 ABC transporter substrate-binding protein [Plastoroseomonas hellenica]